LGRVVERMSRVWAVLLVAEVSARVTDIALLFHAARRPHV
jgi:hypothetical protein